MNLKMANLENCFNQAKTAGAAFIAVKVEMNSFPEPEVIINGQENIDSKLEYYKKTYNENLEHNHAPGIKIIGFTYGENFHEIQKDLV